MPKYTPELVASVVHAYVHTDTPTPQIAADHNISERDITRIRHAAGVPTRRSRARELPPDRREVHEITTRLIAAKPPGDVGRNTRRAAEHIAPPDEDGAMRSAYCALPPASEPDLPALIVRVARLVEHELSAEEATRAELGSLARTPTELERCARIVASMTRSLRELLRLQAGLAPEQGPNDEARMTGDADDIRNELARRIEAFLASREADGAVECAAGAATVA
jgi:hypothetical protein